MRLKSIRVVNYKCFADTGTIELGKNWTVLVGKNNAGKSALLECFRFGEIGNKSHRNLNQVQGIPLNPESEVEVLLELSGRELELATLISDSVAIPMPAGIDGPTFLSNFVFNRPTYDFTIYKSGTVGWRSRTYPSHNLFEKSESTRFARIAPAPDRQSWALHGVAGGDQDSLPEIAGQALSRNTYVFRAERRVQGTSAMQDALRLSPDASNLPGALHCLFTSNHSKFERLLGLVKRVLPDIDSISIPPAGANVQIRIWNSGYREERSELAIPLEECGTGIGQVLAILFVVVTAETGQVIVIDEPNSFLHPGASRTLMQLLRTFDTHQFVITTHSPELIGATEPDKLAVVRCE